MTLSTFLLILVWLSITAYALLAGADFGAGFWDLVAGTPDRGRARRELIEHPSGRSGKPTTFGSSMSS
jgi:cytochrome d ubiquinol oxidase subunit II